MNARMNPGRRTFMRTFASGVSLLPGARLLADKANHREQPAAAEKVPALVYDPLLDSRCRRLANPAGNNWPSRWIWYPGQRTAHIHARTVQASMQRCAQVGYPSCFRQPAPYAFFRKRVLLAEETVVRWAGPLARIRFLTNGAEVNVTQREKVLPAGPVEIVVRIDFARSLPCLLVDGGRTPGLCTDESWEASLDFREWVAAEGASSPGSPDSLPDAEREVIVEIPVDRVVHRSQVTGSAGAFLFASGGEMVVDFRHDELGRLAFELQGKGKLSIRVGESVAEVLDPAEKYFEQWPIPAIQGYPESREIILPPRGMRYACFSSDQPLTLKNVRFLGSVTPVQYRGHFESSDPEVNAIWAAGAATIHACLHDFYLDGIRRDGLPWDDAIMNLEAADSVFFDADAARGSILSLSLPPKPALTDLGIIDTPLYVLLGFESDYSIRGDLDFSKRYRGRLQDILDFFASLQDENGFVNGRDVQPYGFFPDWSASPQTGPDAHGTPAYAQMLLMRAFEIGASFAHRWNDEQLASRYEQTARNLRSAIRGHFWDARQGAYINGFYSSGLPDRRFSSFAQVFAVLFDLADEREWPGLFERVLENPSCRAPNISLFHCYEFMAYAKARRMEIAMETLRGVWGGLLQQGYTRFMEDIRPKDPPLKQLEMYGVPYGNSLCHCWAGAAAVILLVRGILGVWPKGPGYATCDIGPNLGGLSGFKGSVPVPSGAITLEMNRSKGGVVQLPPRVIADLKSCVGPGGARRLSGPGTYPLNWIA